MPRYSALIITVVGVIVLAVVLSERTGRLLEPPTPVSEGAPPADAAAPVGGSRAAEPGAPPPPPRRPEPAAREELAGGAGDDRYPAMPGRDIRIVERGAAADVDRLIFNRTVRREQLAFTRQGDDLRIDHPSFSAILVDQFAGPETAVELGQFKDASEMDLTDPQALGLSAQ